MKRQRQVEQLLFNQTEAAAMLGFSRAKLRMLLDNHEIGFCLSHGQRMLKREHIDAYIEHTYVPSRHEARQERAARRGRAAA